MRNRFMLLLLVTGSIVAAVKAEEAERPYRELVENSPFLTPAFKERLGRRQSVSLKLKFTGYTKVGDVWFFALRDVKSGNHYWLAKDVEEDGIKVVSFKPRKEVINVMVGEVETDLSLETR